MALTKAHEVIKFSDGVWTINEFGLNAMFYIEGTERGLLIDTGTGVGDLKAVVDGIATKPYDVAITHGHVDHAGGVRQWDEVWVHPADFDMVETLSIEMRRFYACKFANSPDNERPFTEDDITNYGRPLPKLLSLSDGQVFDLGGRKVSLIHVPGHTYGSVVFIDDKSRVLFSGDAANPCLLYAFTQISDTEYDFAPIQTGYRGLLRLKEWEGEFDYNFNGHISDGKPLPDGILDDCIACMEGIMDGTVKKEVKIFPPKTELTVATYGQIAIVYKEDNIFEKK
jgi:hydroxyacylglutathione hydrolase